MSDNQEGFPETNNEPAVPVLAPKPQVKQYVTSEGALNEILARVSRLPWSDADPIIQIIKGNFVLLPTS